MSEFVLCYIDAPWAYFTTQPLADQWGDDWDDAPYEHNAGAPYDPPRPDLPAEERANLFPHAWLPDGTPRWRIKRVAFDGDFITPGYGCLNSPWSVQQINRGEIAWLRPAPWSDHAVVIHAGTTLSDFIDAVQRAGGCVYVESVEIARLTRELEEARERVQHIEGQIVALVEAEVISEGKAREILDVGVDEWREIMDRPPVHVDARGVFQVNPADVLLSRAGQEQIQKTAASSAAVLSRDETGGMNSTPDYQADVRAFHEKFTPNQAPDRPTMPPREVRKLRVDLITEERDELLVAFALGDLEAVADAIADLLYVVIGTAVACGIDIDPIWREVHKANMAKEGGAVRKDGKILKPEGWKPPDVRGALERQGWLGNETGEADGATQDQGGRK